MLPLQSRAAASRINAGAAASAARSTKLYLWKRGPVLGETETN
jgi:hypothetical protein